MSRTHVLVELMERADRKHEQIFEQLESGPEGLMGAEASFLERARGFTKAANIVLDAIETEYNAYTAEMLPVALSLYRHAIELHLKAMRQILT